MSTNKQIELILFHLNILIKWIMQIKYKFYNKYAMIVMKPDWKSSTMI